MRNFTTLLGSASLLIAVSLVPVQALAAQPREAECRPILNEINQTENQINRVGNEMEAIAHRLDANDHKREAVQKLIANLDPKTQSTQIKRAQLRLRDIQRENKSLAAERHFLQIERLELKKEIVLLTGDYQKCLKQKPGLDKGK